MYDRHVFAAGKSAYVRGDRPDVECILCEVVAGRDTVPNLEVHRAAGFVVTLNLFPYNPGHLMLLPERHLQDPRQFQPAEVAARHQLLGLCLDALDEVYGPAGYNVGNNLGREAGGSIPHWHEHVVPRYPHEVGFLDVLGGSRVLVEPPDETLPRLRAVFHRLSVAEADP